MKGFAARQHNYLICSSRVKHTEFIKVLFFIGVMFYMKYIYIDKPNCLCRLCIRYSVINKTYFHNNTLRYGRK